MNQSPLSFATNQATADEEEIEAIDSAHRSNSRQPVEVSIVHVSA